ncbi:MAG: pyridoxamine 5'-phosphate oxidase [Gemmataceae bacterium]|nr:pyridoxamine 5'-phosphate oxidase [Gemmataceae bacterium]
MNDRDLPRLDDVVPPATPWPLFTRWYADAEALQLPDPEPAAMTLATVGADGAPSARIVLVRGWDERGFVFYTNYESRKAADLAADSRAALVFYWPECKRQIRIEGTAERVSAAESDAYFQSRPRGHRLSALISPQSAVIPDRQFLEDRMAALERQFAGRDDIPRPPHWGGFRVKPDMIEFWQGRDNRLHDRLRYRRLPDGSWTCERLAP